jgi:HEAT repeat protein
VLKAIVVAVVADALLLAFILLRRTYRKRYFLPYVQNATGQLREVLGRVLGEVATPSLSLDLLQFVGDDLDELRAAAARALGHSPSGLAFDVLSELARDPIWSLH